MVAGVDIEALLSAFPDGLTLIDIKQMCKQAGVTSSITNKQLLHDLQGIAYCNERTKKWKLNSSAKNEDIRATVKQLTCAFKHLTKLLTTHHKKKSRISFSSEEEDDDDSNEEKESDSDDNVKGRFWQRCHFEKKKKLHTLVVRREHKQY